MSGHRCEVSRYDAGHGQTRCVRGGSSFIPCKICQSLGSGHKCFFTPLCAVLDQSAIIPAHFFIETHDAVLEANQRNIKRHPFLPDPTSLRVERTGKKTGRIKLPKLGWVAFRGWYALPGMIRNITLSRRAGQWFASVQWEREVEGPVPSGLPAVGIDMGVAVFAAMSNGETVAPGNFGKKTLRALRKAQRAVSRKKKGSANRRKAVRRVQTLHARVANARKDFLHKLSTTIAKNHGTVVVEALQVRSMSASAKGTVEEPGRNVRQKSGLNRSILDQGWRMFRTLLGYKLADRGGKLVEVPAAYTSQTCSVCGRVDPANRASQARFVCTACGHTENADINAAKNILRRADSPLKPVEGHRIKRPVEAGSTRRAA